MPLGAEVLVFAAVIPRQLMQLQPPFQELPYSLCVHAFSLQMIEVWQCSQERGLPLLVIAF